MGADVAGGLAQGFLPAFQTGMSRLYAQRQQDQQFQLAKQLQDAQLAEIDFNRQRTVAADERAATEAERNQNKLFGKAAEEAGRIVKTENLIDDLVRDGGLSGRQAAAIRAAPVDSRLEQLNQLTGLLRPAPTAQEQADLAKSQAETERATAQAAKARRPDKPDETFKTVKGAELGYSGAQADALFNVSSSGAVEPVIKSSGTTVNLGREQSEFQKAVGRSQAQQYTDIVDRARSGAKNVSKIDRALELNDKAYSGPLAEYQRKAGQYLDYVPGFDAPEGVAPTEELQGILSGLVLEEQILQKGPQTETDAKRLEATVGDISASPAGRKALLGIARKKAEYDQALGSKIDEARERQGENFNLSDAVREAERELGQAPDLLDAVDRLSKGQEIDPNISPEILGKIESMTPDERARRRAELEAREGR